MELRTVDVTRYIMPLREGGSLPALAEADDGFKYFVKFRGAGHGTKALIAALIGGEIARMLGFRLPELVFLNLDEAFGRTEADEEIQDLLQWSRGLNIGLHFLSGALTFDPVVHQVDGKTASQIVWMDAFLTNVDRTIKNTNMLMWHKELWLIDHGASLYFQHSWTNWQQQALTPFVQIKDHVLLPFADQLKETDMAFRQLLTTLFRSIQAKTLPLWATLREPLSGATQRKFHFQSFRMVILTTADRTSRATIRYTLERRHISAGAFSTSPHLLSFSQLLSKGAA